MYILYWFKRFVRTNVCSICNDYYILYYTIFYCMILSLCIFITDIQVMFSLIGEIILRSINNISPALL
jgi:hypothetical protein